MKNEYKKPMLVQIELEECSPICTSAITGDQPESTNPAFSV